MFRSVNVKLFLTFAMSSSVSCVSFKLALGDAVADDGVDQLAQLLGRRRAQGAGGGLDAVGQGDHRALAELRPRAVVAESGPSGTGGLPRDLRPFGEGLLVEEAHVRRAMVLADHVDDGARQVALHRQVDPVLDVLLDDARRDGRRLLLVWG
jgi:hypothetical protein